MEQLMIQDPVLYYAIGYCLVILWLGINFWEKKTKPSLAQTIGVLLWPLTLIAWVLLLTVIGALSLWDWLTTRLKPDKLEEQPNMEENK